MHNNTQSTTTTSTNPSPTFSFNFLSPIQFHSHLFNLPLSFLNASPQSLSFVSPNHHRTTSAPEAKSKYDSIPPRLRERISHAAEHPTLKAAPRLISHLVYSTVNCASSTTPTMKVDGPRPKITIYGDGRRRRPTTTDDDDRSWWLQTTTAKDKDERWKTTMKDHDNGWRRIEARTVDDRWPQWWTMMTDRDDAPQWRATTRVNYHSSRTRNCVNFPLFSSLLTP